MRKRVFGRQFNKDTNQRKALFKGLMRSLAMHEAIKTTESKAKAIRGEFESFITRAKDGEAARYHLVKHLPEETVTRLITDIAPRMAKRNGGYTRIIRLGTRTKDNAEMVLLELVEKGEKAVRVSGKIKTTKPASAKRSGEARKTEKKVSKVTAKVGKKKTAFKPLANLKQLVSRQKKGQA